MAIHPIDMMSALSSEAMDGRAMLMEEDMNGVMKDPKVVSSRTVSFSVESASPLP